MRAIHFFVRGRVQGVWFRASTRVEAERLGLTGWVRNLADGRVEGWAEGDEQSVDELAAYLEQGPPNARVDELTITAEQPRGEKSFMIR